MDTEQTNDGPISTVRAVDRAIAILQCFTADKPSMSVIEIQRRVGLSRPTLYRLLQTLAATNLIKAEGDPQRFRLAHGVMELAHVWLAGLSRIDAARPILEALREKTGETVALFELQEQKRICVLELESFHALKIKRGIGDTGDITTGASGKAILGFMPAQRRAAMLGRISKAKREVLAASLEQVQQQGFAVSHGEVFVGAVAVAAPIYNHNGELTGSLGVFGPRARVRDTDVPRFGRLVVEAASTLSAELGYRGKPEVKPKPPKAPRERKVRGAA